MSIWKRHLCNFFKNEKSEAAPHGTFRCPLCGESAHAVLDDERFRDGLIIARIKHDHPEWVEAGGACEQCLEFYRQNLGITRAHIPVLPRRRES